VHIAILRCQDLPNFITWDIPNVDDLFHEDRLLITAFQERGFDASPVVWRDPDIDWARFDAALIRTTWDYIDNIEEFLRVLSTIDGSPCAMFNSLGAVRWNANKLYLFDLESWGAPIIPTVLASRTQTSDTIEEFGKRGWHNAILKPTIGVGSADSYRVPIDGLEEALIEAASRHKTNEYLVQPFIDAIVTEGEWSYIYFNRTFSHCVLKMPASGDYRAHAIYGGTLQLMKPAPDDLDQVEAILANLPFDLLYTRLDLVRVDGLLSVVELELIEPFLYFRQAPDAVDRLVSATIAKLDGV
jgi:glutathione synthase/RimK-type ligase-like ATP-grasp enzyme